MTSSVVKLNKFPKRSEAKKTHSWWWDSHISLKNSKWLSENLEEMDQNVKRMLKLIEDDADSFAKKAEIYFKKRPELVAHVEEFYRMYRALAERYDHVTGELRKNVPHSDLQSQGSGMSDTGSELNSSLPSPNQRRKSGPRAAGFDVFLGSGGSSSDFGNKEDDSSTVDYDSGSDDSSINNFSVAPIDGDEKVLRKKVFELEAELRDVREKLKRQQEEGGECKHGGLRDLLAKIEGYEREMRDLREKICSSDEEIARLKFKLQNISSPKVANLEIGKNGNKNDSFEQGERIDGLELETTHEEEIRMNKEKLKGSDAEVVSLRHDLENSKSSIQRLQDQLKTAQKDATMWKSKLDKEHREVSKLQDRIARYKTNLSDRDQEIRALRETVSNANKSLSDENLELQAEITKLTKERMYLRDDIKEWDLRCQTLEEEVRRVKAGKMEIEKALRAEIEQLKVAFKVEIDEINEKVKMLVEEVSYRDEKIKHLDSHLKQLHLEHVELIARAEKAHKLVEELNSKVAELQKEIEKQKETIQEGAEGKREAIRQLCFSLEHYRDGYQHLRKAFIGLKRLPVMAS